MKKSRKHRGIPKSELKNSAKIAKLYKQAAVIGAKTRSPNVSDVQFEKLMNKHGKIMSRIFNAQLKRAKLKPVRVSPI